MDHVRAHEKDLVDYALAILPERVPDDPHPRPARRQTTAPASSPSTCATPTRTTSRRSSTARRSPSVPATTARCRSTSGSAKRPARGPASTSTPTVTTSTAWPTRSTRSSAFSSAPHSRPHAAIARSRDMDDLYRDEILEHYRNPHNFGILEQPDDVQGGRQPAVRRPDHADARHQRRRHGRGRRLHRPRLRDQPGVGEHADRRDQGQVARRDRRTWAARTCSTTWASRSARHA